MDDQPPAQNGPSFLDMAYITSPFGYTKLISWFFILLSWCLIAATSEIARHDHLVEFSFILQICCWLDMTFLIFATFGGKKLIYTYLPKLSLDYNSIDLWTNVSNALCLFITACCLSATDLIAYGGEVSHHVKASCAFNWLAFLSSALGAAIMLEHVNVLPIPAWWPFEGMVIPSSENNSSATAPAGNTESYQNKPGSQSPEFKPISKAPEFKPISKPAEKNILDL